MDRVDWDAESWRVVTRRRVPVVRELFQEAPPGDTPASKDLLRVTR